MHDIYQSNYELVKTYAKTVNLPPSSHKDDGKCGSITGQGG